MITPVNMQVYLVRDLRHPHWPPEPARYVAPAQRTIEFAAEHGKDHPRAIWQFFGTEDDAYENEVEIVARYIAMSEETERKFVFEDEPEVLVDRSDDSPPYGEPGRDASGAELAAYYDRTHDLSGFEQSDE